MRGVEVDGQRVDGEITAVQILLDGTPLYGSSAVGCV
jgi:hypothetical protein